MAPAVHPSDPISYAEAAEVEVNLVTASDRE
jgi:hypothetical protein